ncbi:uncharacterized protein LOC115461605 [Microcaecilia unicolor]|uniref:Uncharacterized protein LOC115461605 n=1 Tax=Microcaecilia unicolor TaxID=1415580 RepID=A0A6P7X234_9AMPH|nr:uncharacterized protein LOC115461605 [Microcaecilia unicolor]
MEKAIERAKEDITQLTTKLLQAQEDLESKDKKLKELLRQNEMKGLESQHLQTHLESTKNCLATFQRECEMQRSLQETEGKRQISRIAELEEILREKEELKRETATQWSDLSPPSTAVSEWEIDSMAGEPERDGGDDDDNDRRQHEELERPGLWEEVRGNGTFSEQEVQSPTRLCTPNLPTSRPLTSLSYTHLSDQDSLEMMMLLLSQDSSSEELRQTSLGGLSLGSTPSPSLQVQIQHDSGQGEANEEMEMPSSCEGSLGSADLSQELRDDPVLTLQEGEPPISGRTTPADAEQKIELHVSDTVTATEQDDFIYKIGSSDFSSDSSESTPASKSPTPAVKSRIYSSGCNAVTVRKTMKSNRCMPQAPTPTGISSMCLALLQCPSNPTPQRLEGHCRRTRYCPSLRV